MDNKRGSERILERIGQPDVISDETLKGIINVAREFDVEILDWCQYGQSGIDGVCGKFQVMPDRAGSFIQELISIPNWACRLDIFPLGITDPNAINVDITGGTLAR
ncbi:MAG: hypothetical protein AAGD25_16360 [Cyanobacteria bacterium P01_F01_bin.150]